MKRPFLSHKVKKSTAGGSAVLFILILLGIVGIYYTMKPSPPPPTISEAQKTLIRETRKEREAAKEEFIQAQPPAEAPDPGEPEIYWIFQGTVYDLLREKPVPGATITFSNDFIRDAGRFTTEADSFGSYYIKVPTLGENGYNARVQHADYDNRNVWTADIMQKTKRERYRMSQGVQFGPVSGIHKGFDGFSTQLDLYVFPINLTQEERLEQSDAFRSGP